MVGYVFRKLDFDLAPFVLAMILGPSLEVAFRQSLMGSGGSLFIFWEKPIALTLILLSCLLFLWNLIRGVRSMKASWQKALEEGESSL
jgi:TctA family transporter